MDEKERMKLVIDGNAVYEVDEECMKKGLNRKTESRKEKHYNRNNDVFGRKTKK